ncbi:GGDEF domain-containing protein [Litorimonas sp. RW-G-Af-16]|uniref:GGDEF domain-containing protein n=1 Tax=Litorimonas sp. RW-G-Af-16 TaxID=3241168 RepID=UPI003AAADD9B
MSTQRVSRLLNHGATPLREQGHIIDPRLASENEALSEEIARLRLRVLDLERAADTDPLVPIYNRRAFMREVQRAQTVMARYDMLSTMIYIDLNGFKSINDRFGHAIGDALLKKIGEVLLTGVRDCDMVARLGGDEFGVLLFKTTPKIARAKAGALVCRIAGQKVDMPTDPVSVTAAWGVAPCEAEDTPEQILDRADRAMYMAKRSQNEDSAPDP